MSKWVPQVGDQVMVVATSKHGERRGTARLIDVEPAGDGVYVTWQADYGQSRRGGIGSFGTATFPARGQFGITVELLEVAR